jgi:hypothetical protein
MRFVLGLHLVDTWVLCHQNMISTMQMAPILPVQMVLYCKYSVLTMGSIEVISLL